MAQKLGLSADQKGKVEAIFEQSRLKLIDLNAAVQKEEAILEPLLEADHPDEAKVTTQIDRIAQARGELEKANARMLLGFRGVLTVDQWKKLQAERENGPPRPRRPLAITVHLSPLNRSWGVAPARGSKYVQFPGRCHSTGTLRVRHR
jgi:hypothetical protein